ncbi:MAG: winged helix-turn-helix transcriptional regulator [Lachnospiraceae bacterium]|nr:winged helix-turn-helix transcriptional regulator [Lachnospiraceae bacterium]MCR5083838.1 MarR family winged helix-turn-helix transcriptional regulator [Parasporobacterium sp.]
MKLVEAFNRVYTKFKLNFYKHAFMNFGDREATLSTVESFCMEVIYAMDKPTVNEFAKFIDVSSPNAAYKVNCLIKKGYINRVQSTKDKREFHLEVTEKYLKYYNMSYDYVKTVMARMERVLSKEDVETLKRILKTMSDEMHEVPYYKDPDMN